MSPCHCNADYAQSVSSTMLLWRACLKVLAAHRYYDKFLTRCLERADKRGWEPPLLGDVALSDEFQFSCVLIL